MPPETQAQISSENEAKQMRLAEIELRRQELRKRMEEASKARKAKKGFMTADRKKKLRLLLRKKAAEELKREQERKAEERKWIIEDRCGDPDDIEWATKDELREICEDYYQRIVDCESEKWDIEYQLRKRAFEISELNSKVNDLRGKFQKPILKKVSRYENRFSLLQRKAAEFNIKSQLILRTVRKPDFNLKDLPRDSDDWRSVISSRDSRDSVERDIRPDDFVEVEVGEIPEEGENEDLTSADEMHDECFGKTEPEETENNHTHTFEDKVRPEEETCTEEPLMKGDPCLGGDELQEREHRLEEEPRGELEVVTEEEGRLGGQSQIDGEVQPSENSETLPLQHTEEDLWHYLREAVTGEHPSTVEEFLQNLIGTLQHVPQEYLTPVVEANIKRANSPSSQDGDPLRTLGDGPTEEKEVTSLEVTPNLEEGSVPAHEGSPTSKQVVLDGTSQCPEEETNPAADNEGYSPVEAAA